MRAVSTNLRFRNHLSIIVICALLATACSGESSGSSSNTPYQEGAGSGTAAPIPNEFSGNTGVAPSKNIPPPGFADRQGGAPPFKVPPLQGPAGRAPAFRVPSFSVH